MLYPLSYGGQNRLQAPVYRSDRLSVDGRMLA